MQKMLEKQEAGRPTMTAAKRMGLVCWRRATYPPRELAGRVGLVTCVGVGGWRMMIESLGNNGNNSNVRMPWILSDCVRRIKCGAWAFHTYLLLASVSVRSGDAKEIFEPRNNETRPLFAPADIIFQTRLARPARPLSARRFETYIRLLAKQPRDRISMGRRMEGSNG